MPSIIIDASCAAPVLLPDEDSDYAVKAVSQATSGMGIVPNLFWHECTNLMVVAERRGRITAAAVESKLADLDQLGLETRATPSLAAILRMARSYELSGYDAYYAALAADLGIPLATLDKKLIAAGEAGAFTMWEPPEPSPADESAPGDG